MQLPSTDVAKPCSGTDGITARSHTSLQRLLLDDKQEIPGRRLTGKESKRKENRKG